MAQVCIAAAAAALMAALLGAAVPSPAMAGSSSDLFGVAKRTAAAQWPDSGCRGRERIQWVPQAVLDAEHLVPGLAGDALAVTCSVRVVEGARTWPGPRLCALLQHEFGHLAGRRHTADPADVMYGGTIPWTDPCTRAFPPPRARSKDWSCRTARTAAMAIVWKCKPRARRARRSR